MKTFLKLTIVLSFLVTQATLFAQSSGDFRSRQSGNWSSSSSWQSYNGSVWVNASSTPTSSNGTITILNGHTITITSSVSADQLVVNSGGQITINSGQTLTIPNGTGTDLTVNGALSNAGTITQSSSTAEFNAGSTYTHAVNSGTIPTATWNATSTCSITGVTNAAPSGGTQNFGNLTWNCASQSDDVSFGVALNITGNLTITNSNSNQIRPNDGANHVIGGNYTHSGGNIRWARNSKTTLTVNGSMSISGGEVQLTNGNDSGVVYLKGDFSHTGGSLTETGNGSNSAGKIVFNGTSAQTFTSGGSVTQNINYEVVSGAILQMAAEGTVVNGSSFTLNSGGTLNIKSANGISTSGATGNIRTTIRTYNTAANYIYSGAAQTVGNGLTGARNLTLSGSGTKTFAAANFTSNILGVSVDLNINSGVIASIPNGTSIAVSQRLYLAGVGKANGSYGTTASPATNKDNTFFASTGIVTATLSALPVTLSSFTAKPTTDNKVALAWVTSSESVNKGFSIERQEEGSGKFQSLGFIASKAVGGNSQTTLAYSFKDVTAKNGTNMYRLVQEDLDGTKSYSEVRVVKLNGQSVSMVFPNPSNGAVNISRTADGKKMNIQVIDQSGRIISQVSNITDANYRMNIPQSGIYNIKMMYPETGEQSVQRVVIQK